MACPKYTNSFFRRKPAARVGSLIPTIELRIKEIAGEEGREGREGKEERKEEREN